MTTYIYALIDPISNQVRYVGKADNVKSRLQAHIREAKSGKLSHKCAWIRQVLQDNAMPVLHVLEEVAKDEWKKAEVYYIEEFKKLGANLTNIAKGGEGFESGYVQDNLFLMKKYLGNRYNELKRKCKYKELSKLAITMVGLADKRPDIVPKRWMAIQLP